jgi:hypothetical protein
MSFRKFLSKKAVSLGLALAFALSFSALAAADPAYTYPAQVGTYVNTQADTGLDSNLNVVYFYQTDGADGIAGTVSPHGNDVVNSYSVTANYDEDNEILNYDVTVYFQQGYVSPYYPTKPPTFPVNVEWTKLDSAAVWNPVDVYNNDVSYMTYTGIPVGFGGYLLVDLDFDDDSVHIDGQVLWLYLKALANY